MKYFNYKEFDCPGKPGTGELMDNNFLQKLDKARELLFISIKLLASASPPPTPSGDIFLNPETLNL